MVNSCKHIALLSKALCNLLLIHTYIHTPSADNYHARYWLNHQEHFGVLSLAQEHFDMSTGGVGDQTANSMISG